MLLKILVETDFILVTCMLFRLSIQGKVRDIQIKADFAHRFIKSEIHLCNKNKFLEECEENKDVLQRALEINGIH